MIQQLKTPIERYGIISVLQCTVHVYKTAVGILIVEVLKISRDCLASKSNGRLGY